jgi:hypothetical protein
MARSRSRTSCSIASNRLRSQPSAATTRAPFFGQLYNARGAWALTGFRKSSVCRQLYGCTDGEWFVQTTRSRSDCRYHFDSIVNGELRGARTNPKHEQEVEHGTHSNLRPGLLDGPVSVYRLWRAGLSTVIAASDGGRALGGQWRTWSRRNGWRRARSIGFVRVAHRWQPQHCAERGWRRAERTGADGRQLGRG